MMMMPTPATSRAVPNRSATSRRSRWRWRRARRTRWRNRARTGLRRRCVSRRTCGSVSASAKPLERGAGEVDEIRRHQRQDAGRQKTQHPGDERGNDRDIHGGSNAPTRAAIARRRVICSRGPHAGRGLGCGAGSARLRIAERPPHPRSLRSLDLSPRSGERLFMRNLITDVPGLKVGHAEDIRLGSGSTAVIFDEPAVASIDLRGGGPGTRETALLDPAQTVEGIDAIALSGGSAFGLDAASGVQAWLREQGRGFAVRTARVPIVPAAILFDLSERRRQGLGPFSALSRTRLCRGGRCRLGLCARQRRRRHRRDHGRIAKAVIGSASAQSPDGFIVGALAAVNAAGSVTVGSGPWFWAAPFEAGRRIRRPRPARRLSVAGARAAHQGQHAAKTPRSSSSRPTRY